jgi:serine/threonine protein kinase
VTGLKVIHDNNITHRDLKTENILVNYFEGDLTLKISDFGLATNKDLSSTICGYIYYCLLFF